MTNAGNINNNDIMPSLRSGENVILNNPWVFLPPGTTAQRPTPSATINYRLRFNTDEQLYEYYDAVLGAWTQLQESAFTVGPFVTYTADTSLPDAQNLGLLSNGILKQTISTGIATLDIAVNDIDYYGPGMTGYLQAPAGVKDINGNIVLTFLSTPSAVNYISILNNISGSNVALIANGSDPNVGLVLASKGAGTLFLQSTNTTNPLAIETGTLLQHTTYFLFSNTANTSNITFQDASGTLAFLSDIPAGSPSALTKTDDTNITLTLGGTPATALLEPVSLTLGWTGTLSSTRGGLGVSNPTAHGILIGEGASAVNPIVLSSGQILIGSTGADPVAAAINSGTGILVGNGAGSITVSLAAIASHNILSNITGGSAAPIANTLSDTIDAAIGSVQGDILYRNVSGWVVLPPGTSGQFLTSGGAAANVSWSSQVAPTGQALTEVNDTNVTMTLGGSPTVALLAATSLTLGWTGQLGLTRGGTAASLTASNGGIVYSNASTLAILAGTATANLPLLSGISSAPSWGSFALNLGGALTTAAALTTSGAFAANFTFTGITGVTFPTAGTLATTSQIPTGAALTKTDDTNVTLTLGGSPTTALVNAASLTLGWTGQLSIARGGTSVSSVTTTPAATAWAGWDANLNLSANNFIAGYTTTATAAGNTTLTVGSTSSQFFTGVTTQTVTMPVASTLVNGHHFYVVNNSSGAVTINSSGGNAIQVMAAGTTCNLTCILNSGTNAASWYAEYAFQSGSSTGTVNSGLINQVAWYTANGTAVSGLATANNGVLVTSAGGVPSISSTLPTNIAATTPMFTTGIKDVNGNLIIGFDAQASAVNQITVSDSPISGAVGINATGTDTNIIFSLAGKGTSQCQIKGIANAANVSAGYVGEFITSHKDVGAGVSLTSNTAANMTSISLTAGDWDVYGNIFYTSSVGPTLALGWSSLTSATNPNNSLTAAMSGITGATSLGMVLPPLRVSVSTTTTVYASAFATFAGTCEVTGTLSARRRC